jgi:hypothetical protein
MSYVIFSIFSTPTITIALPLSETLEAVADKLVSVQYTDNQYSPSCKGAWPGEFGYTGSIVAGLIRAYEIKGNDSYKEAAEKGVDYILNSYGGNFYGDEAYALARLTEATGEQAYADLVLDFYDGLDTYAYISGYDQTTPEKATFFLSYHTVAAQMVGAKDVDIWRDALVCYLSYVDDDFSYFPVMTLGVATWALSQTGPLDDTQIDPFGLIAESYWEYVTLSDLPDLLAAHQVISGQYTGSFYVRFDHTAPGPGYEAAGYTEDTIFGLLGLIAADAIGSIDGTELTEDAGLVNEIGEGSDVNWDFEKEIKNAREVLCMSVQKSGLVEEHIWSGSQTYYFFGGELLQTFSE